MKVSEAVDKRMSTRGFLDKPVDKALLDELLVKAQRSPSGGNVQPWRVIALTGDAKQGVIDVAASKLAESPGGEPTDRPIYPEGLWAPYEDRRRAVGHALYDAIGIPKEDKMGRLMWFSRNFQFFNAPIALIIVLDKRMGHGQWAHTGMYMQTLALLAEEAGLASCMQECWGILRDTLHEHLKLPEEEMVYCGMALGYADLDDPANQMRADRAPLSEVVEYRGF